MESEKSINSEEILESSSLDKEEDFIINSSNEKYEVEDIITKEEEYEDIMIPYNKSKVKQDIPFLIYILIFSFIISIAGAIIYIIITNIYIENYIYNDNNVYEKPMVSEHNYSSLTFSNGLEIVLTQVNYDDSAGGAISFNKGYLDSKYPPGFLKLAFLLLNNMNEDDLENLNDYRGTLRQSIEEDYSSVYFSILNSGFQNFLKSFKSFTFFNEENINLNFEEKINIMDKDFEYSRNIIKMRENHLLEFLIYGYKNEKEKDLLYMGNKDIKISSNDDIINIMKEFFKNPNDIKIILYSHYKLSLTKKYALRYLNNIINKVNNYNNKNLNNEYNYNIYNNTNKIIYYQIKKQESNYIKIIYYINNTNASLSQLYIDSGYFNYIKYILSETNEDSLYYNLTKMINESSINIKSISTKIEIIFKKIIKFSIAVELNHYSYNHLKEIILTVYNYIEKIKSHINYFIKEKIDDKRIKELFFIAEQNFTFSEDIHTAEFYKNKGNDLFYKNNFKYFLKDTFLPNNILNKSYSDFMFYINQLKIENSVIIVGINNDTLYDYHLKEEQFCDISKIFNGRKLTKYYGLYYTINPIYDIFDENEFNFNFPDKEIPFYENKYISKYNKNSDDIKCYNGVEMTFKEGFKFLEKSRSNTLNKFYYKNDISFCLPKVYISLHLFHPYLRPNLNVETNKDIFFNFLMYYAYLKRKVDFELSDAIRAGNMINIGFSENRIFVDVLTYTDTSEKILQKIQNFIRNVNFGKYLEVYRDYVAENTLLYDDIDEVMKLSFYRYLSRDKNHIRPPLFNYKNFKMNDNFTKKKEYKYLEEVNCSIIYAYIFGDCDESSAEKLYDLFNSNYYDTDFIEALEKANLALVNLTKNNFVDWMISRDNYIPIKNPDNTYSQLIKNKSYFYTRFATYSYEDRVIIDILNSILVNDKEFKKKKFHTKNFFQNASFIWISTPKNYTFKEIKQFIIKCIRKNFEKDGESLMKKVDYLGNRYYYLLKNVLQKLALKHENLKDAALQLCFASLYNTNADESYDEKIKDYNYFINRIVDIFENRNFYVEFA